MITLAKIEELERQCDNLADLPFMFDSKQEFTNLLSMARMALEASEIINRLIDEKLIVSEYINSIEDARAWLLKWDQT